MKYIKFLMITIALFSVPLSSTPAFANENKLEIIESRADIIGYKFKIEKC